MRVWFGSDNGLGVLSITAGAGIRTRAGLCLEMLFTFTFMHLADAFIQSDLQCIQAIHFFYQYVFYQCDEPIMKVTPVTIFMKKMHFTKCLLLGIKPHVVNHGILLC